ncbi:MAG TPA: HNH endonuclease signature motif containing protein, partial [Nitrososphaeraceae archaeon]|nr:HNH endonuclease signature motif containing protein [Nitrososphaeraceae archaeon]
LTNIVSSLATGDIETTGENLTKVKETIEPRVIKQFKSTTESSEEKVKMSLETSVENAQSGIDKIDPELSKKIEVIFNEVKDLGFGTEEADALLNEKITSDDEYQVYKVFKKLYIAEKNLELMPKILPIVQEIADLGFGTPEADALLNEKITSQEEYDAYKRIKQTQFSNPDVGPSEWDEQSFLEHAKNLIKGWTTDPVIAFDNLIHGDWKIVELRNGQIIVERMPLDASQEVKSKVAKNNANFKLDHIIPLKSGGTNRSENLQIIPTEQWKNNTEVENYISKALKNEKITGAQAREYIIRYKSGQYDIVSDKLRKEYEEKYGGIPLSYEEIKDLIR